MENIENIITIVTSAVVSGILATIVTLWWQAKNEKNKIVTIVIDVTYTLKAYFASFSVVETEKI